MRGADARGEDRHLTIIGIGVDGLAGLSPRARAALDGATAIHGSPRQLALLDGADSLSAIPRKPLSRPLMPALVGDVREALDHGGVFLASGDPMFFGLGATIARIVPDFGGRIVSIPSPSSVSLAAARLGWPLAEIPTVNLLTRSPAILLPHMFPGARFFVLCANAEGPASVAEYLATQGAGQARVHVLSDMTPDAGKHHVATASDLAEHTVGEWSDLVMLAVEMPSSSWSGAALGLASRAPGLADEVFEHDGQLTKQIPRSVVIGLLRPYPGALLWDVGGGSGSISIEWVRAATGARAVCFEADPKRRERIEHNAEALGIGIGGAHGAIEVNGEAPFVIPEDALYMPLADAPDAVFVGGGLTAEGMLDWAWGAVRGGGCFVATAVTAEAEALLHDHRLTYGGQMLRLGVEHLRPLGRYSGWEPTRNLVIYFCDKPEQPNAGESALQEGGPEAT